MGSSLLSPDMQEAYRESLISRGLLPFREVVALLVELVVDRSGLFRSGAAIS